MRKCSHSNVYYHYHDCIMVISITITVLITEENQSLILKFDFSFWKRRKNTSTPSLPSYLWPTASFEVIFLNILIKKRLAFMFSDAYSLFASLEEDPGTLTLMLFSIVIGCLSPLIFFSYKERPAPSCFLWFL